MPRIFITGCGYIGERIASHYRAAGAEVTCMVRSSEHGERLATAGYATIVANLDPDISNPPLNLAGQIVFYLVPPPGGGIVDSRAVHFISLLAEGAPPAKIVYLSATSVYSADGGEPVREDSAAVPESAMGKRRLNAETVFLDYGAATDVPVVILRVSGIYGPGRLPLMQISQGQPLLREEESGPSNRIHADDLTAISVAAAERGKRGDIFNVSDGNPSSMTSYFNACADALGLPRQPQVSISEARQVMSPLMFSYVSQSRVVDNRKMVTDLQVKLRYATLAEGLTASVPSTQ